MDGALASRRAEGAKQRDMGAGELRVEPGWRSHARGALRRTVGRRGPAGVRHPAPALRCRGGGRGHSACGRLRRDARGPGIGAVAARARSGGQPFVTRPLDLDPSAPIFAEAPVRPVVLTVASDESARRGALSAVAEVVDCGDGTHVDTAQMVRRLAERGLKRIHCEGGPHLFGAMVAEGTR